MRAGGGKTAPKNHGDDDCYSAHVCHWLRSKAQLCPSARCTHAQATVHGGCKLQNCCFASGSAAELVYTINWYVLGVRRKGADQQFLAGRLPSCSDLVTVKRACQI